MKYDVIEKYLDELIPNPVCELEYNSDYTLLISIVLSAQTTDKKVNQVTRILFSKYSSLEDLMRAPLDDLKSILHPLGNFNKKAMFVKDMATRLHLEYDDKVPLDEEVLLTFKGVGRKTINVFLSEFKGIPKIAVDTHVERVTKRLGLCKQDATPLKVEMILSKNINPNKWGRRHLQLVLFGRYYCKAIKPECENCQLKNICQYIKTNNKIK